eukprot:1199448-Pleurochrysis_carterae.AAC.2
MLAGLSRTSENKEPGEGKKTANAARRSEGVRARSAAMRAEERCSRAFASSSTHNVKLSASCTRNGAKGSRGFWRETHLRKSARNAA